MRRRTDAWAVAFGDAGVHTSLQNRSARPYCVQKVQRASKEDRETRSQTSSPVRAFGVLPVLLRDPLVPEVGPARPRLSDRAIPASDDRSTLLFPRTENRTTALMNPARRSKKETTTACRSLLVRVL